MPQYVWQSPDWPHFTFAAQELLPLLGRCRKRQGELLARARQLGFEAAHKVFAETLIEDTLKTARIEGQTLDRDSVRSSVARHLGLAQGGLPTADRHVDGLVEVLLDATRNYAQPLTAARLKGWQAALFPTGYSGIRRIAVGEYRKAEHDPMQVVSQRQGRTRVHFEAPPAARLESELDSFLAWWGSGPGNQDGILRAGIAHLWFLTLHPFEDGNGRVGRALLDMALAQDEGLGVRFYSLSSQIERERERYYSILEQTQKGTGDITQWLAWYLGCFERALERAGQVLENVTRKARIWQKLTTEDLSERQRKVVNRLLDAGPDGFEGGLTNRKYVGMTRTSRATAFRELSDLVAKGILEQNPGGGRNASYALAWDRLDQAGPYGEDESLRDL